MRMIERGIREGWMSPWQIAADLAVKVPEALGKLFNDAVSDRNPRVAARCADVLCRMAAHNLALVQAVDHSERLEGGDATEVVTLRITPDE